MTQTRQNQSPKNGNNSRVPNVSKPRALGAAVLAVLSGYGTAAALDTPKKAASAEASVAIAAPASTIKIPETTTTPPTTQKIETTTSTSSTTTTDPKTEHVQGAVVGGGPTNEGGVIERQNETEIGATGEKQFAIDVSEISQDDLKNLSQDLASSIESIYNEGIGLDNGQEPSKSDANIIETRIVNPMMDGTGFRRATVTRAQDTGDLLSVSIGSYTGDYRNPNDATGSSITISNNNGMYGVAAMVSNGEPAFTAIPNADFHDRSEELKLRLEMIRDNV